MFKFSIYPNDIDGYAQLPLTIDKVTPVNAVTINRLREAIINIENELGIAPSGESQTVRDRLDTLAPSNLEPVLEDIESRIFVLEQEIIDHLDLSNIIWDLSGHTGTASYLAGFDGLGNPIDVDPASVGVTDHTALTNITWGLSDHIGTASYLAGFDGLGDPVDVDPASVGVTDHTALTNITWDLSDHIGTASYLAGFDGLGNPIDVDPASVLVTTFTTGIYSAAAVTPTVGSIHDVSGGPIQRRCYSAGVWTDYMPGVGEVTLPVAADFSTVIQAAAALVPVNGGHSRWDFAHSGGVYLLRQRLKSHTGPKGYRMHFSQTTPDFNAGFGLCFRRVASNAEWSCTVSRDVVQTYNWVGGAVPGGSLDSRYAWRTIQWLEIIDDGAAMSVNIGGDLGGRLPTNIMSQAYGVHLGGAPDLVGICGFCVATDPAQLSIFHFDEFTP